MFNFVYVESVQDLVLDSAAVLVESTEVNANVRYRGTKRGKGVKAKSRSSVRNGPYVRGVYAPANERESDDGE